MIFATRSSRSGICRLTSALFVGCALTLTAWGASPETPVPENRTTSTTATERLLVDTGVITVPSKSVSVKRWKEYHHILLDIDHFNWKAPRNFAQGTLETLIQVIDKPTTKTVQAWPILEEPGKNGHHWWKQLSFAEPGVYTRTFEMQDARLYNKKTLTWEDPPPLKMLVVFKYKPGGADKNIPFDDEDAFPMKCRFMWVVVEKGAKYSGWDNYLKPETPPCCALPEEKQTAGRQQ